MSRNILNESAEVNVYLNRDAIDASLPVEALQPSTGDPITISLKGLPTSFTGQAGKVIKVNAGATALEYAVDSTDAFTESLPILRTVDVLSLKFLNGLGSAGQIIKMNAGATALEYASAATESITASLPLLRTGDALSLKGLSALGSANQIIKMNAGGTQFEYANQTDTTYTAQTPLLLNGTQFQLGIVPTSKGGTGLSSLTASKILQVNSNANGYDLINLPTDTTYTGSANNNIIIEVISITGTIPTGNGGSGITSYTAGDLIIGAGGIGPPNALAKLGIGTNGFVLKSNGSLPLWAAESVFDSTLEKNFGTAVAGGNTISVGNSQNTGQTTNVDIYTSSVLNIRNTSGAIVGTFSPVSSTCNLDLKGGIITTATLGNNTTWNGTPIGYNYGGTGLTSLTAAKILQVNASANGYNLIDLPTGTTYTAQTPLSLNGTQFELGIVPYNKGGTGLSSLTASKILQVNASANGYDLINLPTDTTYTAQTPLSLNGTQFELGTIPTSKGGTGLTSIGTAGQVLSVNSGATALEYTTPSSGGADVWEVSSSVSSLIHLKSPISYVSIGSTSFVGYPLYVAGAAKFDSTILAGGLSDTGNRNMIKNVSTSYTQIGSLTIPQVRNYGEYFSSGHNSAYTGGAGARAIGFSTYLGGNHTTLSYPSLATEYGVIYFSINNNSVKNGSRTGGLWPVYINSAGVQTPSDRSLKEHITTIPNPMEIIRKLNGVYFCWKAEASCGQHDCRDTGFIAQEVAEVFPEITTFDEGTKLWGVNYSKIVGLLTEGIKAVDKENT